MALTVWWLTKIYWLINYFCLTECDQRLEYFSQKDEFRTDRRSHIVTPWAHVGAKNERYSSHHVKNPMCSKFFFLSEFKLEFYEQKGYSIKARFKSATSKGVISIWSIYWTAYIITIHLWSKTFRHCIVFFFYQESNSVEKRNLKLMLDLL